MLIEIDDSVMMALKNENPNDEHVILSLTNLFVSSYQGYHILHASIDSLEYFSKMNLGKIAQTTIQTLIKKYSSYKSLTKNISKKLIIYKNKCIQNIGSDFSMDISNVAAINKSVLISENHQDGYFYLSLARELAKESKQNWEINMSIESCGGSQIKETANNTINTEKRFSLMIVDSDKTALKAFIDKVSGLEADKYTEDTWTAFETELNEANAVYEDLNAMQEEINNAYSELVTAFLNLRLIPDKSLLEELINQANGLNAVNYTKATFDGLTKALNEAKAVFDNPNASQVEVDNAKFTLEKAIDSLEANVNTPVNNGDTTTSVKTGDTTNLWYPLVTLAFASIV